MTHQVKSPKQVYDIRSPGGSGHRGTPSGTPTSGSSGTPTSGPTGTPSSCHQMKSGGTPTTGQLTGVKRKVKDTCVDISNLVQDWSALNRMGLDIITNIANIRNVSKLEEESRQTLYNECNRLETCYDSMSELLEKMRYHVVCMRGVVELDSQVVAGGSTSSSSHSTRLPVFQYYTGKDFYEAVSVLLDMYTRELSVKQTVLEQVGSVTDYQTLLVYTSVWQHQPYINDSRLRDIVDRLLRETGSIK